VLLNVYAVLVDLNQMQIALSAFLVNKASSRLWEVCVNSVPAMNFQMKGLALAHLVVPVRRRIMTKTSVWIVLLVPLLLMMDFVSDVPRGPTLAAAVQPNAVFVLLAGNQTPLLPPRDAPSVLEENSLLMELLVSVVLRVLYPLLPALLNALTAFVDMKLIAVRPNAIPAMRDPSPLLMDSVRHVQTTRLVLQGLVRAWIVRPERKRTPPTLNVFPVVLVLSPPVLKHVNPVYLVLSALVPEPSGAILVP